MSGHSVSLCADSNTDISHCRRMSFYLGLLRGLFDFLLTTANFAMKHLKQPRSCSTHAASFGLLVSLYYELSLYCSVVKLCFKLRSLQSSILCLL